MTRGQAGCCGWHHCWLVQAAMLHFHGFENENTFLSGITDASDGSSEYIIWRIAELPPASTFHLFWRFRSPPPGILLTLCPPPQLLFFSALKRFFCLQEADSCQHCGGSGCAPCSLCHGSKLSMLANRFNESISDLRCQACYPHGLEKCQSCSSKQHRLADARAPQRASQWTRSPLCVAISSTCYRLVRIVSAPVLL